MIQYQNDMKQVQVENPRGGQGSAVMTDLLPTLPRNVSFFKKVCLAPHSAVGEHPHIGNAEIYLVLKGEGVIVDNGVEYPVVAGDCHCCFNGGTHSIQNPTDAPMEFLGCIVEE